MEIIQRNFFRLLRSGAFADDELLEPMSASKAWLMCFFVACRSIMGSRD